MNRRIFVFSFFVLIFAYSSPSYAQGIKWLTWEEAIAKSKVEKRMILVDVYTQWCGWCKRMDKNTFQKADVGNYVNEHYYPVRFDAESKRSITIKNKVYNYVASGRRGYHELAASITFGNLSFPTIVFMDDNWNVIQPIPGYQNAKTFKLISKYFAEGFYKTTPWDKFQRETDLPNASPVIHNHR